MYCAILRPMSTYEIEPLANAHCHTGENPYWDDERHLVYWTDIPNGRLYRLDVRTGAWEKFYDGLVVGGFTLQADGTLLLFRENEFAHLNADGSIETVAHTDPATGRFNDVMADPQGRVFAGTMGNPKDFSGGLYRVAVDGSVTKLITGTNCSNGMGFSPDLRQFYWTDSTARKIFVFDYDRATGEIANRREFLSVPEGEGSPDGMAVDAGGCIWSARWDGYGIFRYSPDGELMEKIEFPVAKVSSLIFGGPNLDEIYVTTAGGSDDAGTADGTLYRVRVDVKGQPEFRSRIGLI